MVQVEVHACARAYACACVFVRLRASVVLNWIAEPLAARRGGNLPPTGRAIVAQLAPFKLWWLYILLSS